MPALFDAIIALVAAAVPLYLVERRRRNGHFGVLGFLLVVVWAVVLYGSFVAPKMLVVRRESMALSDGGRQLRVVAISDTHFGFYRHEEWARRIVREANALEPDVVVLLGDLASTLAGTAAFAPLRELRAPLGAYAVLGNWDYGAGAVDVRKAVESTGVEVLTNESVTLDVRGGRVALIGLDDLRHGSPDWDRAFALAPSDAKRIVLVHNPDGAGPAEAYGADLMLAGHTHCGQIRLPIVGAVPRLPTIIGDRFDCGLFSYGKLPLFITAGAGESGPRARLFNPPEIAVLDIAF